MNRTMQFNPLGMIRKSRWTKVFSVITGLYIFGELVFPTTAFALTSGPSQPEASQFEQINVSELVDPFSGDFSYNIPLLEIGGYPINLSYAAGITMDQEASWVGLGWNVNTGAITRNVRGLPDDFWGDEITRNYNVKPNETWGAKVDMGSEIVGFDLKKLGGGGVNLSMGVNVSFNNYTGFNISSSINPSLSIGKGSAFGANVGLGLTASSGSGLDISPNVSFSAKGKEGEMKNLSGSLGFGLNINSRSGLGSMTLNGGCNYSTDVQKSVISRNKTTNKLQVTQERSSISAYSKSFGSSISFATPSFTPQLQKPFKTLALDFRGKVGIGVVTGDLDITLGGYYSGQSLATKVLVSPAFGYLFSEKGQKNKNAIHDFNREKDGSFLPGVTTNLPLTNYTYDLYTINAQGLGGSIRPFRNDASYIYDQYTLSPSTSGSFGFELSPTQIIDVGLDVNVTTVEAQSGKWENGNLAASNIPFVDRRPGDIRENVHFRLAGEMTTDSDDGFYDKIRKEEAIKFPVGKNGLTFAYNRFLNEQGISTVFNGSVSRKNRQRRISSVEYLTAGEVKKLYPHRARYIPSGTPDHHIAQITVVNAEGARYVFALPAYNHEQREVTFAVGTGFENSTPPSVSLDKAYVSYSREDNSINNRKGIDHSYDETITPAYVYTWYLTEVLSADYTDVTGDGPSEDDWGTYTAFYYGNEVNGVYVPDILNYKWRTPVSGSAYLATYNENLKSDPTDDLANVIYGVKDIWYLNRIESKTQVCTFTLSDRYDGYGVTGDINGVAGGNPQKKIDKISLYSKEDYYQYGAGAIPIKEVHFGYSYDLCKGVPNNTGVNPSQNNGGKLTLKTVYFTYEKSGRAKFSPYIFDYHEAGSGENPDYDIREYDRWGYYKPATGSIPNSEYPYTDQDPSVQNDRVQAWNLKEIMLPSGGLIKVNYESDDYGYVQDKQAARMFKLRGLGKNVNSDISASNPDRNKLFTDDNAASTHRYLFFELETPLNQSDYSQSDANQYLRENYLLGKPLLADGPSKYLYFRFLVNVANGGDAGKKEYVSGYAEIESMDSVSVRSTVSGQWNIGCIKLKGVDYDGDGPGYLNPVSKAAWQFSRLYLPRYAFNQPDPTDSSFPAIMERLASANVFSQLVAMFEGVNQRMERQGFGSECDLNASWIRLLDPDGRKLGGGHRVKSVDIEDNWSSMETSESAFSYGQEYEYTYANGKSSGVASWEPAAGADENIHRIPIYMKKEAILAPDERFYIEKPLGESFFPGPSVGYARVVIKNKQRSGVTTNATGHIEHEFHTAKDFPTLVRHTTIGTPARIKSNPLESMFTMHIYDMIAVSQGYTVILNDMHGKKKRERVFDENGNMISGMEYKYSTNGNALNNQVQVVLPDGKTEMREMGVDYDFVADMREMSTTTLGIGVHGNLAAFYVCVPLMLPTLFPDVNSEYTEFRSATITKVIQKTGILTETISYDLGAKVTTQNVAWDASTGQVLITRVNNEYNDDRYAVNFPAHFAYDRMGFASDNWGFVFGSLNNQGDTINWSRATGRLYGNVTQHLAPGDELAVYFPGPRGYFYNGVTLSSNSHRLWVSENSNGDLYLIDYAGAPFVRYNYQLPYMFKVVRSGNRNYPMLPIGSVESMNLPIHGNYVQINNGAQKDTLLNVSATEYREIWKNNFSRPFSKHYLGVECITNPYGMNLVNLFNALTGDQKLNTGGIGVNKVDIENDYPSLAAAFPTIPGCDSLLYSGTPLGYGMIGMPDFDHRAIFNFALHNHCAGPDLICGIQQIICLSDSLRFQVNDFESTQFLPDLVLKEDLNPYETYIYETYVEGTNDYLVVKGVQNGYIHYFLITIPDNCLSISLACDTIFEIYPCNIAVNDIINPYLYGLLGNWRPRKSYTYLEDRRPNVTSTDVDRRKDGYFFVSDYFWERPTVPGGFWKALATSGTNWRWVTEISNYSPYGFEIENKDALGNYSAAVYGYKNTLPMIVAQNAKYKEIGFDGFEDYYLLLPPSQCAKDHFKFDQYRSWVTREDAHTGWYSLKIPGGDTARMIRNITAPYGERNQPQVPFIMGNNDFLGYWSPDSLAAPKKYVVNGWIKQNGYSYVTQDYTNFHIVVRIAGAVVSLPATLKKSPMIDGWQQWEIQFQVPANSQGDIRLEFANNSATDFYLDDVRAHPFDATGKSFVYDARSLKFMAELDENHYATYYEYDEDGSLIRVKKETERGVMTIQENRNKTFKRNIP